jgi:hypothetical protein
MCMRLLLALTSARHEFMDGTPMPRTQPGAGGARSGRSGYPPRYRTSGVIRGMRARRGYGVWRRETGVRQDLQDWLGRSFR